MPSHGQICAWARDDAAFCEELAAAKRRGAWIRAQAFDEVKAAALLARLGAGEGVHDVVATPGMPTWAQYRRWRRLQGPFAEALVLVRQNKRKAWGARFGGRRRDYTPALRDKVLAKLWMGVPAKRLRAADPALPCYKILLRWRREQPEFDRLVSGLLAAWARKRPTWDVGRRCTPELIDWVWGEIVEGGTFRSIGDTPGAPTRGTLARWMRTRPDFAAAVAQACEYREDWFVDHIAMIEDHMGRGMSLGSLKAIRARSAPYRGQLGRLRTLRPGMRRGMRRGRRLASTSLGDG